MNKGGRPKGPSALTLDLQRRVDALLPSCDGDLILALGGVVEDPGAPTQVRLTACRMIGNAMALKFARVLNNEGVSLWRELHGTDAA